MLDGVSGFPLMDGIPRGESFVFFMQMQQSGPASAGTSTIRTSSTVTRVPGGFNDNAQPATISENTTRLPGDVVRTDSVKQFDDGSRRTDVQMDMPDGSVALDTARRSLPDAEGFQKVRVWERAIAPDGTQSGSFRVFRVPSGMEMDWDSAQAQQFLIASVDNALAPDGSFAPSQAAEIPEAAPEDTERSEDAPTSAARRRPVIPLAT